MRGNEGPGGENPPTDSREATRESAPLLPEISVPKGGGALSSIGEKFQVSAATGTASVSIPIAASPGRSGFGPELALSYDSGGGNGPFGLGWSLGLPSITRKTQRGLPRYRDESGSDTFVLAGAEDLVPALRVDGAPDVVEDRLYTRFQGHDYRVTRYRPRLEGLFARVEKWVRRSDGDAHWRTITRDNVTTIFGVSSTARVHWPGDPTRTFRWLIERTYDDKGNISVYEYAKETHEGIAADTHESQRLAGNKAFNQTYLKRIRYGNSRPFLIHLNREGRSAFDEARWWRTNRWYFELVFDYGDHATETPAPEARHGWPARRDPFSSYRAGFEVRTYRLCRRILMFHHFEDAPMLVRSTDLVFDGPDGLGNPVATQLIEARHTAYEPGLPPAPTPSVRFEYSKATVSDELAEVDATEIPSLPDGRRTRFIDLLGEGLPGVLSQSDGAWYYQRNAGRGRFGPPVAVRSLPSITSHSPSTSRLGDVDSSGAIDLVTTGPGLAGTYEIEADEVWQPLVPFDELPNIDWQDPHLRLIDVTGDGLPDLLITEDDCFRFHPSKGRAGYGEAEVVAREISEEAGPAVVFADETQAIFTADMSGDGLSDIVRVREGQVCYWPNTGYGSFGARVQMSNAPFFDDPSAFDPTRVRLGDVDGSGTTDVIYLGNSHVRLWINQAGNGFGDERTIAPFPPVDNLTSTQLLDLLGRGTACLVWTSPAPAGRELPLRYLPLMSSGKPYLLTSIDNGMGVVRNLGYAPSTKFYLSDRRAGRPWITRLPFPVQVVERVETIDEVRGNRFVSRRAYHHGAYDGVEREFCGFGMVEKWDTEAYEAYEGDQAIDVPPVLTRTWFHTGGYFDRHIVSRQYAGEYWAGDPETWQLPDTELPPGLDADEQREACRALKGRMLRSEVYALDGSEASQHPYAVSETSFHIRLEQPRGDRAHAVFFVCDCETLGYHYERDPTDPRITHAHTLEVDRYGRTTRAASIAYPRRHPEIDEQTQMLVTLEEKSFIDLDAGPWTFRAGLPHESRRFEVPGLPFSGLWKQVDLAAALTPSAGADPRRLLGRQLHRYYRDSLDPADPMPIGSAGTLGIAFQKYRLAFDDDVLSRPELGGRITPALLAEGGYRNDITDPSSWWIPTGHAVFPEHPERSFYMPTEARDPFGNPSRVVYDAAQLFPIRAYDAYENETVAEIDYRVLAPRLVTDANGNRTQVVHDTRGMVIATAVMGKDEPGAAIEGDSVAGYRRIIEGDETGLAADVLTDPRRYLQGATSFFYYDVFAWRRERSPACFVSLARETHVVDEDGVPSRIARSVSYSDGFGHIVLAKAEAEDGDAPHYAADGALVFDAGGEPEKRHTTDRWIGSGATVFNNKGQPVRKFEPFFDSRPDFTQEAALVELGVSPLLHYDPLGRVIRTDLPDGSLTRVEFDAWSQTTFDASDTVLESDWLVRHRGELPAAEVAQAELHAGTPTRLLTDVLGRPIVSIAHNKRRVREPDGSYVYADEHIPTRTELDVEGNPVAIYDGRRCEGLDAAASAAHRGNTVMTYVYGYGGLQLYQNSMDGGERWKLEDVAGNLTHGWDARGHHAVTSYDRLRRPVQIQVTRPSGEAITAELMVYGEELDRDAARRANQLRQLVHHFDGAGLLATERFSFKGEPTEVRRTLPARFEEIPDWTSLVALPPSERIATSLLEADGFATTTRRDALGREVSTIPPDGSVVHRSYNKAGLLESLSVNLRGAAEATPLVTEVETNARGQRTRIAYGNGVETTYTYDPETFRLAHLVSSGRPGTLQDLSYRRDAAGNILAIRDGAIEPVYFRNEAVNAESSYVYDSLHRLVQASGRESAAAVGRPDHADLAYHDHIPAQAGALRNYTEHYDYDPVGNIESMRHVARGGSWTRVYDYAPDSDRLASTGDEGSPPGELYPHDAAGNMTAMPHLAALYWDHKDQLVKTEIGPHDDLFCAYDAGRQRARKVRVKDGDRTERIYLGAFEIHRSYSGGGVDTRLDTLHILDGDERLCMIETPVRRGGHDITSTEPRQRYQLSNHLGSAVAELDDDANPITYEEYHPYGTTAFRSRNGRPAKRYRFTGMERDEETGLGYHTARYYASWLGRWCSADPEGLADGTNLFAYGRASPLSLRDPRGTQALGVSRCDEDCDAATDAESATDQAHRERHPEEERDRARDVVAAGFHVDPSLPMAEILSRVLDFAIDLLEAGLDQLTIDGIVAHILIGNWFRLRSGDPTIMLDNGMRQIERALADLGDWRREPDPEANFRLRPDIFRASTGEVWEIKPARQGAAVARAQARVYRDQLRRRGSWAELGESFPEGHHEITITEGIRLEFWSPSAGAVLYQWHRDRPPEPVGEPSTEEQDETSNEPGILERLADALPSLPEPEPVPAPQPAPVTATMLLMIAVMIALSPVGI